MRRRRGRPSVRQNVRVAAANAVPVGRPRRRNVEYVRQADTLEPPEASPESAPEVQVLVDNPREDVENIVKYIKMIFLHIQSEHNIPKNCLVILQRKKIISKILTSDGTHLRKHLNN